MADQSLVGFMPNDEWDALLAELNGRIEALEGLPDGDARQQVFELLDGIDALHREALRRLVRLFKEGVLEQVVTDPAIHTLMELYDLLPESELPKPRTASKFPTIPIRAITAAAPPPPLRYPHWVPVLSQRDELPPGGLRADLVIDGQPLLLARRGGDEWYALDATCPIDESPLRGATLSGYTLSCPNHAGCHYDLRSGARVGGGKAIPCRPVQVDAGGRVLVGLDMDFTPSLPSF
ncbi:MAG: Rieske (2Fe-2S) protein [Pseudomonadota bacterium]|jgi:nitrite reductase/ring-hydroxylating ferredoxin subunit